MGRYSTTQAQKEHLYVLAPLAGGLHSLYYSVAFKYLIPQGDVERKQCQPKSVNWICGGQESRDGEKRAEYSQQQWKLLSIVPGMWQVSLRSDKLRCFEIHDEGSINLRCEGPVFEAESTFMSMCRLIV